MGEGRGDKERAAATKSARARDWAMEDGWVRMEVAERTEKEEEERRRGPRGEKGGGASGIRGLGQPRHEKRVVTAWEGGPERGEGSGGEGRVAAGTAETQGVGKTARREAREMTTGMRAMEPRGMEEIC